MEGIVVAFFVPVVVFLVVVAPIWIIVHYKSKANVVNGLSSGERAELN
jgi:phage shock protein B